MWGGLTPTLPGNPALASSQWLLLNELPVATSQRGDAAMRGGRIQSTLRYPRKDCNRPAGRLCGGDGTVNATHLHLLALLFPTVISLHHVFIATTGETNGSESKCRTCLAFAFRMNFILSSGYCLINDFVSWYHRFEAATGTHLLAICSTSHTTGRFSARKFSR